MCEKTCIELFNNKGVNPIIPFIFRCETNLLPYIILPREKTETIGAKGGMLLSTTLSRHQSQTFPIRTQLFY